MAKEFKFVVDKLPPSKNLLYYGSSYKNAYKHYILKNYKEISDFVKAISSSTGYKEFIVKVKFYVPKNKYKKFEPQNYLEVLADVLFGENRDHYIRAGYFEKIPSEKERLIISISPL